MKKILVALLENGLKERRDDVELARRTAMINGITSTGVVFLTALGLLALLRGVLVVAIVDAAAVVILLADLLYLGRTGDFRTASRVGVGFMAVVFLYFLVSGGDSTTGFVWYPTYPLFATFLLGSRKGGMASTILILFAVVFFVLAPFTSGTFFAYYSVQFEVRFVASYIVIAVFSFFFEYFREITSARLAEQNIDLQKTVAQLTEADEALEEVNAELRSEIVDRWKAQEELRGARDRAEAASRSKSEFLANMSHELRTPLNHIIGFSELVAARDLGPLNEQQVEYMRDVVSSGRHLLEVINDVLDLSRIEAGRTDLELSETDLAAVVTASANVVQEAADQQDITIAIDTDGAPRTVVADRRRLRQVMYNLLANAVKFTEPGGVVRITARICPETSDCAEVTVTDSGIGIDPKHLRRIFEDFEQVEESQSRRYQGTGLGLALSRRLIDMHHGRIWAESGGRGRGSTFRFVIPIGGPDGSLAPADEWTNGEIRRPAADADRPSS